MGAADYKQGCLDVWEEMKLSPNSRESPPSVVLEDRLKLVFRKEMSTGCTTFAEPTQ